MGKVIYPRKGEVHTTPSTFKPTLNDNSWEKIRAASDAGIASTLWKVGDCKEITLNGMVGNFTFNNYTTHAYIIGFDHNAELEGSNRIHFQIGKTALISGTDIALCDDKHNTSVSSTGYFSMNSRNTNSGGWEGSQMRTVICEAMKSVIPAELQTVIKSVTKYTDNKGNSSAASAVTATTEHFFLLSEYEVFGSISNSNSNEKDKQQQYDYYSVGNSKIKYIHSNAGTATRWFLRSPRSANSSYFTSVADSGINANSMAYYSYGFAPAFCV